MNQCQEMFNGMVFPSGPTSGPASGPVSGPVGSLVRSQGVRQAPAPLDLSSNKRPFPSDAPPSGGRPLQPKPASAGYLDVALNVEEQPPAKKKRGRPTKAETQARREAAMARGEMYPTQPKRDSAASTARPPWAGGDEGTSMPSFAAQAAQAAYAHHAPAPAPQPQRLPTPQPPNKTPPPTVGAPGGTPPETGSARKRRGRSPKTEPEEQQRQERASPGPRMVTPSRGYPDIMNREPSSSSIGPSVAGSFAGPSAGLSSGPSSGHVINPPSRPSYQTPYGTLPPPPHRPPAQQSSRSTDSPAP